MTEQEIKDILQQQNHFFSSGGSLTVEYQEKYLQVL